MYKWAGEVTQLIRALTAMPDDLSLTPESKWRVLILQTVVRLPHICAIICVCTCACAHIHIHKVNKCKHFIFLICKISVSGSGREGRSSIKSRYVGAETA